jgi:acyl-coenzyme A thioesterase PaaI-like protein
VVHGGILTTLLDHVGSFSGLYCTTPRSRTLLRHSLPHKQLRGAIEKREYRGCRPADRGRA